MKKDEVFKKYKGSLITNQWIAYQAMCTCQPLNAFMMHIY